VSIPPNEITIQGLDWDDNSQIIWALVKKLGGKCTLTTDEVTPSPSSGLVFHLDEEHKVLIIAT